MKIIELKNKALEIQSCHECPITYFDNNGDACCSLAVDNGGYISEKDFREDCPLKEKRILKEGDKIRVTEPAYKTILWVDSLIGEHTIKRVFKSEAIVLLSNGLYAEEAWCERL